MNSSLFPHNHYYSIRSKGNTMAERKVLNKYYQADFDPTKIPKRERTRSKQMAIRLMAENMKCNSCGQYIYRGKKFNSKLGTVEGEDYLGLNIYRAYIKCPGCLSEIAFKTDPNSGGYVIETGASPFIANSTESKFMNETEGKVDTYHMDILERRAEQSKQETQVVENLEDLKELKSSQAKINPDKLLDALKRDQDEELSRQQDEEDKKIKSWLRTKRVHDQLLNSEKEPIQHKRKRTDTVNKEKGGKSLISGLVRPKSKKAGYVKLNQSN